eukprot:gene4123-5877_t
MGIRHFGQQIIIYFITFFIVLYVDSWNVAGFFKIDAGSRSKLRTDSFGTDHIQRFSRVKLSNECANGEIYDAITSNDVSFIEIFSKVTSITDSTANGQSNGEKIDIQQFASIFRNCAPYIAMHRGAIMVIHIGGHIFQNKESFEAVMDDISILHLLGIQLVLVIGMRKQLDDRIHQVGAVPAYHDGMRITDEISMKFLKEESGSARFEIESSLTRGFRGIAGNSGTSVVSGNVFYSAKPLGVRDGIDFKYTGEVRKIESDNIKRRLSAGDIVMITSLGYSASGEVFNVPSESLAAECAARLEASKVIFLTEGQGLVDKRSGNVIQNLRLSQAVALLQSLGISKSHFNYVEDNESKSHLNNNMMKSTVAYDSNGNLEIVSSNTDYSSLDTTLISSYIRLISRCVYALNGGVRRGHLISSRKGSLLMELFTRDGEGMLISRDTYEGIRAATESDLRSIMDIIRPLEEDGILIPRSKEQLLQDLPNFYVLTRDQTTIACGMLKAYSESFAEISCLAVHPSFRRGGRGETLLAYLERRALLVGLTHVFVLSTRTMQWFEERGFVISNSSMIPSSRKINPNRGSKIYIKKLGSQRDVDVEELLWNIT